MILGNKILILILSLVVAESVQQSNTAQPTTTIKPAKNNTSKIKLKINETEDSNRYHYVGPKGDCTHVQFHMKDCAQIVSSLSSQIISTSIKPACNLTCHNQSLPEHCKSNATSPVEEIVIVKQVDAKRDDGKKKPKSTYVSDKKRKAGKTPDKDHKPVVVGSKLDSSKFKGNQASEKKEENEPKPAAKLTDSEKKKMPKLGSKRQKEEGKKDDKKESKEKK